MDQPNRKLTKKGACTRQTPLVFALARALAVVVDTLEHVSYLREVDPCFVE